jgi:hypothetical protein
MIHILSLFINFGFRSPRIKKLILSETLFGYQCCNIMGKNFFGFEEWKTLYGMRFSKRWLCEVLVSPWGEDVLNASCPFVKGKRIKETHFIFLGLTTVSSKPLNILRFHRLHPPAGQPRFYSDPDPWYIKENFAAEKTCALRWYMMPLDNIPNSTSKTYREQVAILPPEYEVPFAVEDVTKNILYYKKWYLPQP